MKLVRIQTVDGPRWGAMEAGGVRSVRWEGPTPKLGDELLSGPLLAPVEPPLVIAIGLNYRKHAEETGATLPRYPIVFVKFPNSVVGPNAPIVLPRQLRSDKVDYECELAFVVNRDVKNVKREDALETILGFTAANDVSARDWQKEWGGGQWCKAKSFDGFCPVGPCLVTPDELPNFSDLAISTRVNGETLQDSRTSDLIFDIPTLIEFLSGSTTLPAGTLVLTGTPNGVGAARTPPRWLIPGDVVEVEIEGVGVLRNPVIEEVTD